MDDLDFRLMEKLKMFQDIDNNLNLSNHNTNNNYNYVNNNNNNNSINNNSNYNNIKSNNNNLSNNINNSKPAYKVENKDLVHKNISDRNANKSKNVKEIVKPAKYSDKSLNKLNLNSNSSSNNNSNNINSNNNNNNNNNSSSSNNLYQKTKDNDREQVSLPQNFNNLYDFTGNISNMSNIERHNKEYYHSNQVQNNKDNRNKINNYNDNINQVESNVITNIPGDLFHSIVNYTNNNINYNSNNVNNINKNEENIYRTNNPSLYSFKTNETSPINNKNTNHNTNYNTNYNTNNNTGANSRKTPTKTINLKNNFSKIHKKEEKQISSKNTNVVVDKPRNISPSPSGDRLYNNGILSKQKKDEYRNNYNNNLKLQMTPDISSRSKNIKRDPTKYHERLYPTHKISTNKLRMDISNDNIEQEEEIFDSLYERNIYRKRSEKNHETKYDYKPKIDEKSKKMAEKFGPALKRLLEKRKRPARSTTPVNKNTKHTYTDPNMSFRSNSNNSKVATTPSKRITELYTKGLDFMKKRETLAEEKKKKDAESYTEYSYKPDMCRSRSRSKSQDKNKSNMSNIVRIEGKEIYERSANWKKEILQRKEKERENNITKTKELCTFKPETNNDKLADDEPFIKKNLGQIYQYVDRRQKSLNKQKNDDDYKKKIFKTGENYVMKPTIPKEFNLRLDSRINNKNKVKEKNTNFSNYMNNDRFRQDDIEDFKEERKNTINNILDEFTNKNKHGYSNQNQHVIHGTHGTHGTQQGYGKNNQNIQHSYNTQHGSQHGTEHDKGVELSQENQMAFLDAVNNLHDKLVNLNI